jgi:hypothetical protein
MGAVQAIAQDKVYTKGTAPMPGGMGKFGQTYTVLQGDTPVNITITGAEYTVGQFNIKNDQEVEPDADHKMLLIHFKLKNPNPNDLYISSQNFFQVVDSQNNTIDDGGDCRQETDKGTLDVTLKPGQGTAVVTSFIIVPASGIIPKLILKRKVSGTSYEVIRFDLQNPANAVKPLAAPYADPSDKTGGTALTSIPATVGTTYAYGWLNMSVDSIALAAGPFGSLTADDGKQFLVATVTITNPTWVHRYYTADSIKTTVKTDDDKVTDADYLKAKHDDPFSDDTLDPNDTESHRIMIKVPKDAKLKTLTIYIDMGNDGKGRAFVYDLSEVK